MKNLTSQKGFTLIELVITVVLMAIMAAVGVPQVENFLQTSTLDAATRTVHSDIRYAQTLAQTAGEAYGFRATSATEYEVYNVDTDEVVISPYHQKPLIVDLTDVRTGINFAADLYPAYVVEFDEYGLPSESMIVQIMAYDNSDSQYIQISQSSGLIMRNNPTCNELDCL